MSNGQSADAAADSYMGASLNWLQQITTELGRPLRVLHIGNIANNAFYNARLQRQSGIAADVLSADYYHIMATPEWDEAIFDQAPADAFFPDWSSLDLHGYQRPRWFAAAPLPDASRYLAAWVEGQEGRSAYLWRKMEHERYVRCSKNWDARLGLFLRKIKWKLRYEWQKLIKRLVLFVRDPEKNAVSLGALSWEQLTAAWSQKRAGMPMPAVRSDLLHYWENYRHLQSLLSHYDIVHGYAQDGIWALIDGRAYVAHEHGTLRQLPFEDHAVGRQVALVYGLADQVIVTNIDCLESADRLNIGTERVSSLPHPFDDAKLRRFREEHAELRPPADRLRFVIPSRQDWQDRDPNFAKGNDLFFRALAAVYDPNIPTEIVAVAWGRDLEASKALISELGLASIVTWVTPMSKIELWLTYLESHAVIDQFQLLAFGTVTAEALALGRRVLTALDINSARRFFGEPPPLLAGCTIDQIAAGLRQVMHDRDDHAGIGDKAADWVAHYHSAERLMSIQMRIYQLMLEKDPLKQNSRSSFRA